MKKMQSALQWETQENSSEPVLIHVIPYKPDCGDVMVRTEEIFWKTETTEDFYIHINPDPVLVIFTVVFINNYMWDSADSTTAQHL